MVVALLIVLFGVLVHFSGDWGGDGIMAAARDKLTVDSGSQTYGIIWFVTSVIVSGIGLGGMTLPESWPAVLSANGSRAVSKNHVMLPLYTLATFIPIVIGFYAASHVTVGEGEENSAILTIADNALPGWLMGCVLIAGISCAIAPAAHCVLSIATLVSSNLIPENTTNERRLLIGKTAAGVILLASLWLSLARPDLMANLYLLTYAGLAQLAPANILSCTRSTFINAKGLIAGLVVGEVIVIGYTIADTTLWGMNNGIPALVANLVVMVVVSVVTGKAERPEFPEMPTRRIPVSTVDSVAPVTVGSHS